MTVRATQFVATATNSGNEGAARVTHLYVQVAVTNCIPTSGRIITTPLHDETLRPQFIGHKVIVEVTTDPPSVGEEAATWSTLTWGYCSRATLVDALTWEFAIGDVDRVEREAMLFDGLASNQTGQAATIPLGTPPLLLGARMSGAYYQGALANLDLPIFEVADVESAQFIELSYVSGPLLAVSGANAQAYLNTIARAFALTTTAYTDHLWVYPDIAVELFDVATGAAVTDAFGSLRVVYGQWTPIAWTATTPELAPVLFKVPAYNFLIDWATDQPTVGTRYRVKIWVGRATTLTPFQIFEHPVEIAAAIYDLLGIAYDATSVADTKAVLGEWMRVFLRPTEPIKALSMLEDWLYGPFGFAYRVTNGVRAFYPTRYRAAGDEPSTTLTLADLRGEGTPYDLSNRGGVSRVNWEEQAYRLWMSTYENGDVNQRPLDTFLPYESVTSFVTDDTNAPPYLGTHTIHYPGYIDERYGGLAGYKQRTAQEIFWRWGRGTIEVTLLLLPGFAEQIGDFVINTINFSPIPEAGEAPLTIRPKDYPLRSPRQLLQLVKRSEAPEGPIGVFQVGGPVTAADPNLDVPELSLSAGVQYPKNTALVTVTNWAVLTTLYSNGRLEFWYNTGTSEPTTWVLFNSLTISSLLAGLATTPIAVAGSHVWVRARVLDPAGHPGPWSDVADLDLDELDPPTALAADVIDDTVRVWIRWTNGEPTEPVVLRYGAGATPSAWSEIAQLAPGTTAYIYPFPEADQLYTIEAYHRQTIIANSESTHASVTVTTGDQSLTLAAPVNPVVATGGGAATLSVVLGDPMAEAVVFEVAEETGLLVFGAFSIYATVPCDGSLWPSPGPWIFAQFLTPQRVSPGDETRNMYFQLRAYHTARGFTDSVPTTPLTCDPWATTPQQQYVANNLSTYAEGDLLVADSSGQVQPLAVGGVDEILTSDGTTVSWQPAPATGIDGVEVQAEGTEVGTRPAINLIEGAGVTLTVTDNSGADRVDVTVDVAPAGGGLEILSEGSSVGTRPALNFIAGSGIIELLVEDNSGDDRVDVTISAGPPPDAPPASPDAMDDEMDSSSGLWSWNNQGGASVSYANGRMQIDCPTNAGNNWRHLYQALPGSGAWEFRAKFIGLFPDKIWHLGLSVRNSSTSDFVAVGRSYSGAYYAPHVEKWTSNVDYSSNPYLTNSYFELMHNPYYVAISYDTTDLRWLWSNTGEEGTFIELLKETPATFIGAGMDQICLSFMVNDASVAGRGWVSWFRRTT